MMSLLPCHVERVERGLPRQRVGVRIGVVVLVETGISNVRGHEGKHGLDDLRPVGADEVALFPIVREQDLRHEEVPDGEELIGRLLVRQHLVDERLHLE
jgi:hypothetical protein